MNNLDLEHWYVIDMLNGSELTEALAEADAIRVALGFRLDNGENMDISVVRVNKSGVVTEHSALFGRTINR